MPDLYCLLCDAKQFQKTGDLLGSVLGRITLSCIYMMMYGPNNKHVVLVSAEVGAEECYAYTSSVLRGTCLTQRNHFGLPVHVHESYLVFILLCFCF
jgi:hypothetical protein